MTYKVKDLKLAAAGKLKVEWAQKEMPVLAKIKQEFEKNKPFKNQTVVACLHITKETAVLLLALQAGGARVVACGSNPLSTQDSVAAFLAKSRINIFAWHGISNKDYYWCLEQVLSIKPDLVIDDGADLISLIHSEHPELINKIKAAQEETTTGVIRLKAMAKDGALKFPVVAVNDTPTKHMFDNYYGTGQSTLGAIMRATNVLLSGKKVVVAGYGYCGKGIALRAKGLGAQVTVTEVDAVCGLQAVMDGFEVKTMREAAGNGEIFVTATGDIDVITGEDIKQMKDGAILCNSGHFNVEIDLKALKFLSKSTRNISDVMQEYILKTGKKIFVLAEGRLVNLAAAEGHPSAVMDMSFSDQALTCAWLAKNYQDLSNQVHNVPGDIDTKVAQLKLSAMGVKIDKLTDRQKKYLNSWNEGT